MELKKTAILALMSMIYFWALRGLGLLYPQFFMIPYVVDVSIILSFLASLVWALFFASFYSQCQSELRENLAKTAIWGIIGAVFGLVMRGKILLIFYGIYAPWFFLHSRMFDALAPFVGSLFILFFWLGYYFEAKRQNSFYLTKRLLLAVSGFSILTTIHGVTLYHFFLVSKFNSQSDFWFKSDFSHIIINSASFIGMGLIVFFWFVFLRHFSKNRSVL